MYGANCFHRLPPSNCRQMSDCVVDGSRMSHSRATCSNVFAARSVRVDFCSLRSWLGSMWSAGNAPSSSRRFRGFARPTSGSTPSESRFSLPPMRYFSLHRLPPAGTTSKYSPLLSQSLKILVRGWHSGLQLRSRRWGNSLRRKPACPPLAPRCQCTDMHFDGQSK